MGANARVQYQNQFIKTPPDQITTGTANTDEILLAETGWDEVINGITPEGVVTHADFTPKGYGYEATEVKKGDVYQNIGDATNPEWVFKFSLYEFSINYDTTNNKYEDIGEIDAATQATDFNIATLNGIKVCTQAITGVPAARIQGASAPVTVKGGDIFEGVDETNDVWALRGNLLDSKNLSMGDISVILSLPNSPNTNAIGIFSADAFATLKGGILQYQNNDWVLKGNLTNFTDITTLGAVSLADANTDFDTAATLNDILVADQNITGITAARIVGASTTADKGEIFQCTTAGGVNSAVYTSRGNLTDLLDIDTLDDIRVTATSTITGADENDVDVFSAAVDVNVTHGVGSGAENKFHPVQPLITEASIRGGGENIALPYRTGNSAQTKDAPGPVSIEDSIMFANTGDGMELVYRMMTQDREPEVTMVDGGPETNAKIRTVVEAESLATGSSLVRTPQDSDLAGDKFVNFNSPNPTGGSNWLISQNHLNDKVVDTTANPRKIPVRLEIDPSAAPNGTGIIKLEGYDKNRLPVEEYLVWTDGNACQPTKNFYTGLKAYSSSGWATGTTFSIKFLDKSRKVVYTPQDEELVAFWFTRLVRGVTPTMFSGIIGSEFSAALGRDTPLEWTVGCLGKRQWPNTNIRGEEWNSGDGTITENNRRGRKVLLDKSIGFAPPEIFTGWQCEVDMGGTRLAIIDGTLNINQNLENSGVITGDRYEESPPFRSTDRETMLDGTVVYAPENNLSQVYLDNATIENVFLNLRNRPRGSFYWLHRFIFDSTQINTNPDPASPRDGRISQAFNLKCFTEGIGGGPKDYRIETFVSEYTPVRDFS